MTKYDLERLVMECLTDYVSDVPRKPSKLVKENTMKKSELKALVNEVVRQCVQEAGPQYKVRGKKSQLEQPGLRNKAREIQCDPQINEDFGAEFGAEGGDEGGAEFGGAGGEEKTEVELLKQMAQILLKLLQMHRGESPAGDVGDVGDEDESPEVPDAPEPPEASQDAPEASEDDEEELQESNHKVQARSYKTVKDLPNDPKNVRDPEVPQS